MVMCRIMGSQRYLTTMIPGEQQRHNRHMWVEHHEQLRVEQGTYYEGHHAKHTRKEAIEPAIDRLRKKFEKNQPISKTGKKRWYIAVPMTSLLHERRGTLNRGDSHKMALHGPNEHKLRAIQRSKTYSYHGPATLIQTYFHIYCLPIQHLPT